MKLSQLPSYSGVHYIICKKIKEKETVFIQKKRQVKPVKQKLK